MPIQRLRLEIEAAPSYEYVLSLAAAASGGGWEAPSGLAAEVAAFAPSEMVWAHLLTVACDASPPRDLDSVYAAVRALHPRELRLRLLGYYVRYFRRETPAEVIAAAAGGDRGAAAEFIATSYVGDGPWQESLRNLLPLTAEETRRALLRLLVAWRPIFEANHRPDLLAREVAARRAQARSLRPEQVVAAVMDGWEYLPEPGINAVLLVPSIVTWPLAHVFDHHSTKLICYPVLSAGETEAVAPPPDLVALGQAIGDPRRLRVLRELAAGELPAQELSIRLGIGLTTLIHHLAVLRSAGLVSAGDGRRKVYRLRSERVAELGAGLHRYLGG